MKKLTEEDKHLLWWAFNVMTGPNAPLTLDELVRRMTNTGAVEVDKLPPESDATPVANDQSAALGSDETEVRPRTPRPGDPVRLKTFGLRHLATKSFVPKDRNYTIKSVAERLRGGDSIDLGFSVIGPDGVAWGYVDQLAWDDGAGCWVYDLNSRRDG